MLAVRKGLPGLIEQTRRRRTAEAFISGYIHLPRLAICPTLASAAPAIHNRW